VQGDAVALVEDVVVLDAGPVEAFFDLIERLREKGLVLGPDRVVEDEEQAPVVPLRVRVVQDERPRIPDVQRTARIRREAEDDLPVDRVRERRQLLGSHRDGRPFEEFRREQLELGALRVEGGPVHFRDHLLHVRGRFARLRPQVRVLREHPAQDRLRLRFPSMQDRILQRELPRGFEAHDRPNRRRVLRLLGHGGDRSPPF
jgi:hypothetical protein